MVLTVKSQRCQSVVGPRVGASPRRLQGRTFRSVLAASTNGTGPPLATATPTATATALKPAAPIPAPRLSYRVSFFGELAACRPACSLPSLHTLDAMKFNGPAPELVNGRLAMLGIVVTAVQESETGSTALHLLNHVSIGTCLGLAVWVYASLVPILKGVKQEAFGESQGAIRQGTDCPAPGRP